MLRAVAEAVVLFLIPFALFALWLALSRRAPHRAEHWEGALATLAIAGLIVAAGGIVASGLFVNTHRGAYVPAKVENGQLVPGHIE